MFTGLGLIIIFDVFILWIYELLIKLVIHPLEEEVEEVEKMIANFQQVFCPTPEQKKEQDERIQRMTNLEKLYEVVTSKDEDGLYEWLEEFALWHDPGGWFDKDSTKEYFLDDEWRE